MFKKFKDGVSKTFSDIGSKLGTTSNAISGLIKETNQYINAEEVVTKESKEAIETLKVYAETETPSLKEAITELATTFEVIEEARAEKVTKLREDFIAPLQDLVVGLEALQKEQRESENAVKEMERAQKKLEKSKAKPKEKLKPNEVELAEKELELSKEKAEKESEDVKAETEKFNKKKLETMQTILKNLSAIQTAFHKKALDASKGVKAKADAIKVEEESKVTLE